jgi:lysophospholipase L1-like esterase
MIFTNDHKKQSSIDNTHTHTQCEHLLYRLQNGELPSSLHAKVFWVLIGTNDLGAYGCSADSIAAGNIRIVEELKKHRDDDPKSTTKKTIVLNSILPRAGGDTRNPRVNVYENPRHDWQIIQRINQWLECYADSTPGVEFFNATDLFIDESGYGIQEYYEDPVHPSAKGHKHWAKAIVDKIKQLI